MRNRCWIPILLLAAAPALGQDMPQGPLASQVGRQIELKGRHGIGKLASLVLTDRGHVYLFAPSPDLSGLKSGVEIVARGTLEYDRGIRPSDCEAYECAVAGIPPYYFIRGASVVIAPARTEP
ncbi:hypothetical protein [Pseudomonas sp. CGJS7]|uniref:hypothetical protein n=1 Tax=Pseudomonas sp. CGJS7 TaxID=3109348 RepID=UPI00300A1135